MRVRPVQLALEFNKPAPGYVRSPGLHMSAIYGDLYAQLDPKRYGGTDGPDPVRMEAGLAFEEMLEEGLRRRLLGERPGEFITEEGIVYSPDALFFEDDRTVLGEFKCTWQSSNGYPVAEGDVFPAKADKWLCQMMAYAYHLETVYGRLIVFFVNGGGWKTGNGPLVLSWDIEWTQRELDENWAGLRNHALHTKMLPILEATE